MWGFCTRYILLNLNQYSSPPLNIFIPITTAIVSLKLQIELNNITFLLFEAIRNFLGSSVLLILSWFSSNLSISNAQNCTKTNFRKNYLHASRPKLQCRNVRSCRFSAKTLLKRSYQIEEFYFSPMFFCGQSYKASKSVNYDSTVVITSKLILFTTLDM